jgi:hypothetical protein
VSHQARRSADSGAGQTRHEAAKHITTNMVKEAANLVVSSSAIIANHDMGPSSP